MSAGSWGPGPWGGDPGSWTEGDPWSGPGPGGSGSAGTHGGTGDPGQGDPTGGDPKEGDPKETDPKEGGGTTGGTSASGGSTGNADGPTAALPRTTVHLLTLGSHLQAGSFEAFAREQYLPALQARKGGPGRAPTVRLLRRRRESPNDALDLDRQFVLLVEGSAPLDEVLLVDDPTVRRRFEAYAPQIVRLGGFDLVQADAGSTHGGPR